MKDDLKENHKILFSPDEFYYEKIQVPVEERPHSCNYCYKRFARADECKRHERIHTDTRPFGKLGKV